MLLRSGIRYRFFLAVQRHERMIGSKPLFHSHSRNSAIRSQPHSLLVPRPGELAMPAKKQPCSSDVPITRCPDVRIFHTSAFCCTTDFDLQRHLQQFFPPSMRLVACSRLKPLFYIPGRPAVTRPAKRDFLRTRYFSRNVEKKTLAFREGFYITLF